MTRLWKNATLTPLLGVLLLLFTPSAPADTLALPPETPAAEQGQSITLPGRGMSMISVEERFGQPRTKYDEVGDPPITRWVYSDFTVYFEYQYVINAVAHDRAGQP